MKLRFNPVIFILLLIFAVCVFLLLFHFLKTPITVEGKWYCEKLGLQISLTEDSFVISNDGNEIACNAYSLKGSQRIVVYCLEEDCDQWELADVVFSGKIIKKHGDELYIRERYTDILYTFKHVP